MERDDTEDIGAVFLRRGPFRWDWRDLAHTEWIEPLVPFCPWFCGAQLRRRRARRKRRLDLLVGGFHIVVHLAITTAAVRRRRPVNHHHHLARLRVPGHSVPVVMIEGQEYYQQREEENKSPTPLHQVLANRQKYVPTAQWVRTESRKMPFYRGQMTPISRWINNNQQ